MAGRQVRLPGSQAARISLGVALVAGGVLGFLPVVGFWMVPLGVTVLAVDLPAVRSLRRRFEVAFGRWRQGKNGRARNRNEHKDT